MASLVDTHAHLNQKEFNADRDAIVARAVAAGVETLIAIGVQAATSRECIALAAKYPGVFASVGIQPNYVAEVVADEWDQIVALAKEPGVVTIGETGLDRYWKDVPFELQQDYFDRHIRLSQSTGLPLSIHMRECDDDIYVMLAEAHTRGPLRGVMHSYTGTPEMAAKYVELGMHISFAGMATYKNAEDVRTTAKSVPADRILVETDSPYLAPVPLRGKRNEPANVVHTAQVLAEVRGVSFEEFAAQSTANARQLFRLAK